MANREHASIALAGLLAPDIRDSQESVLRHYQSEFGPNVGETYYSVKLVQAIRRRSKRSPELDTALVSLGELFTLTMQSVITDRTANPADRRGALKLIAELALESSDNPLKDG